MTVNMGDLSVVMPVFNEAKRVRAAIERVLEQDFVSELIVVDDGSTDNTWECILQVVDDRVRPIRRALNQAKVRLCELALEMRPPHSWQFTTPIWSMTRQT